MDVAPWIQKANSLAGMPQEIIDTDFTQREERQKFMKTALGILQTFVLKIMWLNLQIFLRAKICGYH